MSSIALTYKHISNKITAFSWPKINWKAICWVGLLCSALMLAFYVYSVNKMTKSAYLIKNYGKEMELLFRENRSLEAQFTESGLLEQFMQKATALSFEKTTNPTYVQILDDSLAKAK